MRYRDASCARKPDAARTRRSSGSVRRSTALPASSSSVEILNRTATRVSAARQVLRHHSEAAPELLAQHPPMERRRPPRTNDLVLAIDGCIEEAGLGLLVVVVDGREQADPA